MKPITLLAFGMTSLLAASLSFGQTQTTKEITRAALQANKKAIVAQNMNLTEAEEKVFWPLYDEYQIHQNKLADRFAAVVNKYAINYENMSDELADELLTEVLKIEKDEWKLKNTWMGKFKKELSPKTVVRYYQIENKMDAIINIDVTRQIPLIK